MDVHSGEQACFSQVITVPSKHWNIQRYLDFLELLDIMYDKEMSFFNLKFYVIFNLLEIEFEGVSILFTHQRTQLASLSSLITQLL